MRPKPSPPEPRLAWAWVAERTVGAYGIDTPPLGGDGRRTLETTPDLLLPVPTGEPYVLTTVGTWRRLPPRQRPDSYCPVCLERVTLKLGPQKRHHYAHRPDSACAAAGGEGALHLSAKLHLAHALAAGGTELDIQPICRRAPQDGTRERCPPAEVLALPHRWDGIRIEQGFPSVRADLLLTLRGAPVLAIEVCATHAVDEGKAEKYRLLGLPWIEVPAHTLLPEEAPAWSPPRPLPTLASSHRPLPWRCRRHELLWQAHLDTEANGVHPAAWRMVHLYRTDGGIAAAKVKVEPLLLQMMEKREDGEPVSAWLEREASDSPLRPPVAVSSREEAARLLHTHFLAWARWTRAERGIVIDSPMTWTEGAPPPKRERPALFPERMRMNPHSGSFVGVPGTPRHAWPLPLHRHASPHPLFGDAPVLWREDAVRDLPALVHAVHPPCWLTVRVHGWAEEGERRARADFALHVHDGRRWRAVSSASRYASAPAGGDIGWEAALTALAARCAERAGELLETPRLFRILVEELEAPA